VLSVKSRIVPNEDGTFTASDDEQEISVEQAASLQFASTLHTILKALTVNSTLASNIRRVLPMHVGSLRLLEELTSNMINDLPEVPGDGSMDDLLQEELMALAAQLMAVAQGQQPVQRDVTEKAGRTISGRNMNAAKSILEQALSLVKAGGMGFDDVVGLARGTFGVRVQQASDDEPSAVKNAQILAAHDESIGDIASRLKVLEKTTGIFHIKGVVEQQVEKRLVVLPDNGLPDDSQLDYEQVNKEFDSALMIKSKT
jgi:hypothetical protein